MAKPRKTTSVPYQPTDREQAVVDGYQARHAGKPPLPRIRVEVKENGGIAAHIDYPDAQTGGTMTAASLGVRFGAEVESVLEKAILLTRRSGQPDEVAMNRFLATVAAIDPQDSVESMLAVQMAALHEATLSAASKARSAELFDHAQLYGNQTVKLSRAFAGHVETLKRYRSTGDQKVTVVHEHRHVHLHNGADETGASTEIGSLPHGREQLLSAERAAVLSYIEADGLPLPGTSDDRAERVPVSRRKDADQDGGR